MRLKNKHLWGRVASVFALAVFVMFSFGSKASAAVTAQGFGVPMYQYPTIGTFWSDITGIGGSKLPFVIVDPASGPGVSVDPNYTTAISNNTASNIRSIGYVDTNYRARTYQSVIDDIDSWHQMYPGVTGIFLDRIQTLDATDRCYVASIYNHVKNNHPNDLVILNPGTNISQAYEPYGDIFLNAENTYAAYQSSWSIQYPGWEDNPAYSNRFWQILHTTDSSNYAAALSLLQANNAGWVYITDDVMPNPYDTTPSYWTTEVNDVSSLPLPAVPNRGKTQLPSGCQDLTASTTTTTTKAARSVTTASNVTVTNTSSAFNVEPTTKITFAMPTGVTLSGSGTNWACDPSTGVCNYNSTINASGTASVLGASFTAGCDYTSGNVNGALSNFAGNTFSFSVAPERPGDCPAATLANTGVPTMLIGATAALCAAVAARVYFSRTRIHYVLAGVRRRR